MKTLLLLLALATPSAVAATDPDCTGTERWPAKMSFVHLKNAGLLASERTDFAKTKVVRIASEKVGKDLYRQVHPIEFTDRSGATVDVIAVNDVTNEECSGSGVDVFVVARHLGGHE
jgi:hypothetical protein